MNNIKSYWENKTERAKKALEHTKELDKLELKMK